MHRRILRFASRARSHLHETHRLAALALAVSLAPALAGCAIEQDGGTLDGDGYTLEIADGWEDTTDDAPSADELGIDDPAVAQIDLDAIISGDEGDTGFRPNLAIVTTSAGRAADPAKLAEANLETTSASGTLPSGAGGGSISTEDSKVTETELGGEPAAYYEVVADAPPGSVRQRQVYAIQDGTAYALTYSGLEGGQFEEDVAAVEQMLASWTWE